jgi:CRP/FNR family transcriptional regulator
MISSTDLDERTIDHPSLHGLVEETPCFSFTAGHRIFRAGEPCRDLAILGSGTARVYVSGGRDRQVILYHLEPDDLCPVSLASLLSGGAYPADAIAETDVKIRYLQARTVKVLLQAHPELHAQCLAFLAASYCSSIGQTRDLLFDPLDIRLARLLSEQFKRSADNAIRLTHDDVASELGTTRVVASRMLKKLEQNDCIELHRRKISLKHSHALQKLLSISDHAEAPA